ncbi:MFS transporter [Hamadaea sp. NPDC050747]|uniref:MFS transporter n=1 Tax=Hamadaea sp. NPDC050747 TaxID=3155789 RepID=UPI0033DCBA38
MAGSYGRVLRQPALRRILPGMLVSALGDGMSMVAVAWLAVQIAPADQAGVWTGLAVAAYALPATLGAALLARFVRRFSGVRLVAVDASLRAVVLGGIAALAVAGALGPALYVGLLALSSLLHAWGNAGAYTVVAEVLPEEDRVTGNALVSTFTQAAVLVGPALGGLLLAAVSPGWVIAADAASFAVLAAICWATAPGYTATASPDDATASPDDVTEEPAGGWRTLRSQPKLLGLLAVTCVFFFLYGPVEVALPIHVATEAHASASLLGLYWTVFGVGCTVGGLAAGFLRHQPLWLVVISIIVGWGAALLPLGLTDSVAPGLVGMAIGGLIYGPFTAICTALFQRLSPPSALSRVLAARSALTIPATALGVMLGGPLVSAVGGRQTLLISAVLTIAFGVAVAVVLAVAHNVGQRRELAEAA